MNAALTPPFVAAALVLCIAGAAKLRSPGGAVTALAVAGLPVGAPVVRGLACLELALGGWCVVDPSRLNAAGLAAVYVVFAGLAVVLVRRRAACGCFGERDAQASPIQSLLSAGFALIGALAAIAPPHGVGWVVDRAPGSAATLAVGIAGCAYAIVIAYTDLPQAWEAWSAR